MAPVAIGLSEAFPLGPKVPLQPERAAFELPDATQLVARVDDQVIVVVV
jgi:hypothetical protein